MPYKKMMSIVATVPLIFLIAFVSVPEFDLRIFQNPTGADFQDFKS
jgi:hypothetical protein